MTQRGPYERAARREARRRDFDLGGDKYRVLIALAKFADKGVANPRVSEIAAVSRVHRMSVARFKLPALEAAGLIRIHAGPPDRPRAAYELNFAPDPQPAAAAATTKEATVPTKTTTTKTIALPLPPGAPNWAANGNFLPSGEMEIVTEPATLKKVRRRHASRLAAVRAAETQADQAVALGALADLIIDLVDLIRADEIELLGAYDAAAEAVSPRTRPREESGVAVVEAIDDPHRDEVERKIAQEIVELKPRRAALDRDRDRIGRLRELISPTVLRGSTAVPRLVAQAEQLREDLAAVPPEKTIEERVAALESSG